MLSKNRNSLMFKAKKRATSFLIPKIKTGFNYL